ncbi:MAG: hypothetical protein HY684_03715 [Chloroflexi bacterium]|nr:hypothetical protein [Chloroflexota bacterium]
MLDAINLERKGIPTAVVGLDRLLNTVGKGMARVQGYPEMRFAAIPYLGTLQATEEAIREKALDVVPKVERILISEPKPQTSPATGGRQQKA